MRSRTRTTSTKKNTAKAPTDWVSVNEAAAVLGVHPGTVRVWSDKGMLPVYRTQGGHRRYKRSEVELWADTARGHEDVDAASVVQAATRNIRMQISDGRLEAEPWYEKLDDEARGQYRESARSLFSGLSAYLTSGGEAGASEAHSIGYEYASRGQYRESARSLFSGLSAYLTSGGEAGASEAHSIGYEYASRGRRFGLSQVDATRAFLFFRGVLMQSVIQVYQSANVPSGRAWGDILQGVNGFTDLILLNLMETYAAMEQAEDQRDFGS